MAPRLAKKLARSIPRAAFQPLVARINARLMTRDTRMVHRANLRFIEFRGCWVSCSDLLSVEFMGLLMEKLQRQPEWPGRRYTGNNSAVTELQGADFK